MSKSTQRTVARILFALAIICIPIAIVRSFFASGDNPLLALGIFGGFLGGAIFWLSARFLPEPPVPAVTLPEPEPLPPPVEPVPPKEPIKGLMRVDVTRTDKTVDVWILLSEHALFVVKSKNVLEIPIEQTFEGFSQHMSEYKYNRKRSFEEIDADVIKHMKPKHREGYLENYGMIASDDVHTEHDALEVEAKRYKEEHTAYLKDYLKYPYRKIVANELEAANFRKRLKSEYIPKIKTILDTAGNAAESETIDVE